VKLYFRSQWEFIVSFSYVESKFTIKAIGLESNYWDHRRNKVNKFNHNFEINYRGVQAYVHCVMHKCIMVKLGGKRNTHKVCKKTRKFY